MRSGAILTIGCLFGLAVGLSVTALKNVPADEVVTIPKFETDWMLADFCSEFPDSKLEQGLAVSTSGEVYEFANCEDAAELGVIPNDTGLHTYHIVP